MTLYQHKPSPFIIRLFSALANPLTLILLALSIVLAYFAWQGDVSTPPVKAMWFGAGFLLFIFALVCYGILKDAVTQLVQIDLSDQGLKVQKVVRDQVAETLTPVKDVELELTTHRNKRPVASGEWNSYQLNFIDRKAHTVLCAVGGTKTVLKEVLEKIKGQNLIELKAAENDFLLIVNQPEKFSVLKSYRRLKQVVSVLTLLFVIYKVTPFVQSVISNYTNPSQQIAADTTAVQGVGEDPLDDIYSESAEDQEARGTMGDYQNDDYEYSEPYPDTTSYPAPQSGLLLSTPAISQLLKNFFQGFASSEWQRQKFKPDLSLNVLDENGKQYGLGMYLAGPASVYELSYDYFLKDFTDTEKQNCPWPYLPCNMERLSGIKPLLTIVSEEEKFNRYNPQFIRWAYTYMIPQPDTEIINSVPAREIYAKVFRRSLRMHTLAWCYLQANDYYYAQYAYQKAAQEEINFSGVRYLQERYNQALPNYNMEADAAQQPAMAIGFWLRRGIDGTNKDCWLGLQKAMNMYDPIWFHKTLIEHGLEANTRVNNP